MALIKHRLVCSSEHKHKLLAVNAMLLSQQQCFVNRLTPLGRTAVRAARGAWQQSSVTGTPSGSTDSILARLSIPNIRDLSQGCPNIRPGRVIRSSVPHEASAEDAQVLLGQLAISDLIDLRSSVEHAEDPANSPFLSQATFCQYNRSWPTGHIPLPAAPSAARVICHQISPLERLRFELSLLWHIPFTSTSRAVLWRLLGQKESSRLILLKWVNEGGLLLLYKIILDSAHPEILAALRVISASLEQNRRVLVFCKAGKDRTGIMSMLLMSCAGATREQIIDDYHRSDAYHKVALAGIESRDELRGLDRAAFERAPKAAMSGCLDYLEQKHGSVAGYMERVGFTAAEQARLRELLTSPELPAKP